MQPDGGALGGSSGFGGSSHKPRHDAGAEVAGAGSELDTYEGEHSDYAQRMLTKEDLAGLKTNKYMRKIGSIND